MYSVLLEETVKTGVRRTSNKVPVDEDECGQTEVVTDLQFFRDVLCGRDDVPNLRATDSLL
jgi:hypothetical protein